MSKATPRPWVVHPLELYEGYGAYAVIGNDGETVCDAQTYYPKAVKEADQRLIVRAVNAHDAMREALMAVCDPDNYKHAGEPHESVLALAAAALKLANEEE